MTILTEHEQELIILRALESTAPDSMSEDDLMILLNWATQVRVDGTCLDMFIKGQLTVRIVNGEPAFGLSQQGRADAQAVIDHTPLMS